MKPSENTRQQMTMWQTPNDGLMKRPCDSCNQEEREEAMTFRKAFPSELSVATYFVPGRWDDFLDNPKRSTEFPSVTLRMLDVLYRDGLAVSLVKNNLVGIFTVTRPRDPLCVQAIELTAKMFVGKYRAELSVYGMQHFFATYLTDIKSSFSQFDLTDVLRQCGKVYMPKWRERVARVGRTQEAEGRRKQEKKLTGMPALVAYFKCEYVDKGIDIRTSPLFNAELFKGTELEQIINETGKTFKSQN